MAGWSSKFFKLMQRIGVVRYSGKKNIYGLHPLIISTIVIALAVLLANAIRKLIKSVLNDGLIKEIFLEIVATAELCACCFELIIVADNYGVVAYAIYLFLLTIWWSSTWENATACPYNPLEEVLEGSKQLHKALLIIASQLLGGIVIFRYVQLIWSIELAETHRGRAYEDCTADLAVPMAIGALIEAFATFLCRVISRSLGEFDLRLGNVLDAFFATSLVVAAFNFSGGYFNPALATSLKFGCDGNTFLEHVVVYWIGATAGSIASVYFYRLSFVQNVFNKYRIKMD